MASWIAAGNSYSDESISVNSFLCLLFDVWISAIGDLAWAAGDIRCRGFIIGRNSGPNHFSGRGIATHRWS